MQRFQFPFTTEPQLITDMANSAKATVRCLKGLDVRCNDIEDLFALRVHELMAHRPHNVNEWN